MRKTNNIEDRVMLKKACREACNQSLSIIYQKYRKSVCGYLHKAGADGFAEDICQDVFVRISENRCNYDGSSEVQAYLFRVAKNILQDRLRLKTEATYPPERITSLILSKVSPAPEPESELMIREDLQKLKVNIQKLSPKSREAIEIWLRDGGLDGPLPQRKLPCNRDTFRKRFGYAIKQLSKMF